jgi:hypothetical protein
MIHNLLNARRSSAVAAFALALGAFPLPGAAAAEGEKITFQDHALPILRQRCGSCHDPDTKTAGLDVTSFVGIMQGGGSGEVITPGDASGSYLFRLVTHEDEPTMPPDSPPIPQAEQDILRKWIDGGVLENEGSVAMVPKKKANVAMAGSTMERPEIVPEPARLPLEPAVHTSALDACASIATSPWGPVAAVAGQRQVLLFDTDSLNLEGVLPFPEGRPHIVRFSRGGGLVLAGGGIGAASGKVVIWDLRSGRRVQEVGEELDVVLGADMSPDQRLVALGGPKRVVRVYSAETGELKFEHTKHTDWVQAMAYSPDGVLLATADRSGGVFLWEALSGRDYMTIEAHPASVTSVAWRADANMLATACEDGQIRLYELENGKLLKNWGAHGGGVAAIEFTRDGRIVSIGRDKVTKLWKTDGSQERAFDAFADVGLAVSYCDETNRLIAGDWTGEIRVWNAADGARVGSLEQNPLPIAQHVALAEQAMAEQRSKLSTAEAGLSANVAAIEQFVAAIEGTKAERQRLETMLADLVVQQQQMGAGLENARKAHAEVLTQFAEAESAVVMTMSALEQAEAALAAAGEEEAAKLAAEQALAAAKTAHGEAANRRDQLKQMAEAKAAEVASAEKTVADLAARSEASKAALVTTETQRQESEAALAEARNQAPQVVAALTAAKNETAAAAEQLSRWYENLAFQANYDARFAALEDTENALEQTQIALAEAQAAKQAVEQTRQGHESALAELQGKVASLQAANATAGQEISDLAAKLETRTGEIAATQAGIEKILQATAALEQAATNLDQGLAVLPDDAELKAAREAIAGVVAAKQTQLTAQRDAMAAMIAEKEGWEKGVAERREMIASREAEMASANTSITEVEKQLQAAVAEVEKAGTVVDERTAAVGEREAAVEAAEGELNALQGIDS